MSSQQSPGEWQRPPMFPAAALLLCLVGAVALNIPPEIFSQGYRSQPAPPSPPAIPPPIVVQGSSSPAPSPAPNASPVASPSVPGARAPIMPPTVIVDPNAAVTPAPGGSPAGTAGPVPMIPPTATVDPDAPLPTGPNLAPPEQPPATINGNPVRGSDVAPPTITGLPPAGPPVIPPAVILEASERKRRRAGTADLRRHLAPRIFAGRTARSQLDRTRPRRRRTPRAWGA